MVAGARGRPSARAAHLRLRQLSGRHRVQRAAVPHARGAARRHAAPDRRLRVRARLSRVRRAGRQHRPAGEGGGAADPRSADRERAPIERSVAEMPARERARRSHPGRPCGPRRAARTATRSRLCDEPESAASASAIARRRVAGRGAALFSWSSGGTSRPDAHGREPIGATRGRARASGGRMACALAAGRRRAAAVPLLRSRDDRADGGAGTLRVSRRLRLVRGRRRVRDAAVLSRAARRRAAAARGRRAAIVAAPARSSPSTGSPSTRRSSRRATCSTASSGRPAGAAAPRHAASGPAVLARRERRAARRSAALEAAIARRARERRRAGIRDSGAVLPVRADRRRAAARRRARAQPPRPAVARGAHGAAAGSGSPGPEAARDAREALALGRVYARGGLDASARATLSRAPR